MPEQITTAAELDSLPIGSVVMTETHRGFGGGYEQRVWMRHGGQGSPLIHDWQSTDGGFQRVGEPEHARGMWAVNRNVTVLYRPDAPSLGADDQAGGPLEGAPKPSAEAVADALIKYETGGICHYGQTCGLCDCGRSDQTAEQRREWDEHQLDRARAVLALIPPQRCVPSEDELAEALHADACPVIVAAVLKPIRELHRPHPYADAELRSVSPSLPEFVCAHCVTPFPCPTVRLLDQIEADCNGGE